ncbi:MAG: ATP-binding protein [Halodesulfurarchaeum sp.]
MAVDPLVVVAFTVLPAVALGGGLVASVWYAVTIDRRLLVGTALFALMGAHQLTEVWVLLAGGNPYTALSGELFETIVNLLTVATVLVLSRRLEAERLRRERQAVVTSTLETDSVPGDGGSGPEDTRHGLFSPAVFGLPILGRLVSWAFATLPFGTTADLSVVIETVARNLQVTYPVTAVDRDRIEDVTVFAEPITLEDVLETVLKQFVVYNDSSEPTIRIAVDVEGSRVRIRISDNGPGLPAAIADQLTGAAAESGRPNLELGAAHGLLEKWGGSIGVADGTVELTLLRPRPQQNESAN